MSTDLGFTLGSDTSEDLPPEVLTLSTLPTELRQRIFYFTLKLDHGDSSYEVVPKRPSWKYNSTNKLIPINTGRRWVYLRPSSKGELRLRNFLGLLLTDRRTNTDANYLMIQNAGFEVKIGQPHYRPTSLLPPEMLPHITSLAIHVCECLYLEDNYQRTLKHFQDLVAELRKGHSVRCLQIQFAPEGKTQHSGSWPYSFTVVTVSEDYQHVLEPLVELSGTGVSSLDLKGDLTENFRNGLVRCVTIDAVKPRKVEYELFYRVVKKGKRNKKTVAVRKDTKCFDLTYQWNSTA